MNENSETPINRRNIWVRGLFMLLMILAYHVSSTVLIVTTLIQFLIVLMNGEPNVRLVSFGSSLAHYFRQVVNFMTFATEDIPFPFSDWPASD